MFYSEFTRSNDVLERVVDNYRNPVTREATDLDEELAESRVLAQARFREAISAQGLELDSTRTFADQLLIIGLWASVEQFAGRTLAESEQLLCMPTHRSPHQWSRLVERFKRIGLDLSTCKGYSDANECRVVNNKIKHVGFVDEELERYSVFSGIAGLPLEEVKLELQRYSDSVFEFVGHIMEAMDSILASRLPPT